MELVYSLLLLHLIYLRKAIEQFRGCLIGQCLGDAVGCRVEGYPPEVCQNFVSYEVRLKKIKDRDRFGFPFGQYTDDSQLARETASKLSRLWRIRPQRLCRPYC
ncbi:MAG: ADP-ribosylglycohydrolase family protein [Microcoleus sp.]